MYKRDFGCLLLSICAVYLSLQHESPFTFKKAWYHLFVEQEGLLQEKQPTLPPPLVADLNGDGKPEVLTATPDGKLRILAPRRAGDGFARAQVLTDWELEPPSADGHIATFKTGYLMPPPKELVRAPRKQVVALVTRGIRLVVLDHNLKQLWTQDLAIHFAPHGSIRELGVLVSDRAISTGDKGLIVVGASVIPLTLADREEDVGSVVENTIVMEGLERMHAHGRGLKAAARQQGLQDLKRDGRHFSYFAFEGGSGSLRWKHDAEDFHRNLAELSEELLKQHSFHMRAEEAEGRHYGEASCRDYRESVLAALPHAWYSNADTALVQAHFVKHRSGKGAQKQQVHKLATLRQQQHQPGRKGPTSSPGTVVRSGGDGVVTRMLGGLAGSGRSRTSVQGAPAEPPNVVVAHLEEGLEMVHLFSGRTVCRLHLEPASLHADLNSDGVPDHIVAIVTSGIPPQHHLWNGTICRPFRSSLSRLPLLSPVEVAPPVVLPIPGQHGKYRGHKALAVFLNSRGELTAYSANGKLLWQTSIGADWNVVEDEVAKGRHVPTLRAMPLRTHATPSVLLAADSHSASIVSEYGAVLESMELPEVPSMALQLVDWNFDGLVDVVVVGREGMYAWAQVRRPGVLRFSALLGALLVCMAAVFITQQGLMEGKRRVRSTDCTD
eukprot:scaffold2.g7059.t1